MRFFQVMYHKTLVTLISFGLLFSLAQCVNDAKNKVKKPLSAAEQAEISVGFQLLESNCFSCHSPNADFENRIAPPMIAIKKHYITEETSLDQFTKDILAFTNNPSEEKSKMPGALKKFGLMPKMNFSEDQIRKIAAYIYHTELEAPSWFKNHYEAERKKHGQFVATDTLSYVDQGLKLAMATKGVLGKNLMGAIQSKGTEGALEFCNTKAFPLTDSMATVLNARIKRVSDKNRNPENAANTHELAYIHASKAQLAAGEKIKPQVQEINGKMVGYYPIETNKMCLQCHGTAQMELKDATLAKIHQLYPNDKAIGYGENELRGIWVIEMDKKE